MSRSGQIGLDSRRARGVQVARENELEYTVIGCAGQPEAHARLERERGCATVVKYRKELVRLLCARVEVPQRAKVVVFLGGKRPCLGEIEGDACRRRKVETWNGVQRQIQPGLGPAGEPIGPFRDPVQ